MSEVKEELPTYAELLKNWDSFVYEKKRLTDDIEFRKEKLAKERPFSTEDEIKYDLKRIAELEQALKEDRATFEAREKAKKPYRAQEKEWHEFQEDRWRNHYDETCQDWCESSRAIIDHAYRVQQGLGFDDDCINCPRCSRKFDGKDRRSAHMMAAYVNYDFPDNLWFVATGYGSIISDGDLFLVKQPHKMGSALRQNYVFCDFCLVELLEKGVLSMVFQRDFAVVDEVLFKKFRYGDREPSEYEKQRTHWL